MTEHTAKKYPSKSLSPYDTMTLKPQTYIHFKYIFFGTLQRYMQNMYRCEI